MKIKIITSFFLLVSIAISAQDRPDLLFSFDNNLKSENHQFIGGEHSFVPGIDGQALSLNPETGYCSLSMDNALFDGTKDFSIQCWIKTTSKNPTVFLSQKDFNNKGISTQKNAGWALYSSNGTFAWSIGSGDRRINYERDNGEMMPINDGEWHQMTVTYSKETSEFRLYYDGHNRAVYYIGFDFSNNQPLTIGSVKRDFDYKNEYLNEIIRGSEQIQEFVDEFNNIGLEPLKNDEFINLIVDPEKLFEQKGGKQIESEAEAGKENLSKALDIRNKFQSNPYTVFQNRELTETKPISKIYALKGSKIVINESEARFFTGEEKLYPSDFEMDELSIWNRAISPEEILDTFTEYRKGEPIMLSESLNDFNVGVWNIWHGGIHWSKEVDGWDSRIRIAEMIKEKNLDVILMQETYSSGDFIAAELGYYFACTSDWDYCFQGANISVISRYPIKEIKVTEETEFNNVAVKLAISETQEIWAMSNWYGMAQFPTVFDFHKARFENSDKIPVLFGGDFNAVPHTDGGDSPASKKMLEEGFTDAYRSLFPDVEKYAGYSHRSGSRIDQLYYKGKGLINKSTEVISSWPAGFPSDHFLIVSVFKLDY